MSYYPTERRGGCMESLARCCRQAYVYPLDTRKLLYAAGAIIGVLLIAVVWSGLSSSSDNPQPEHFKGRTVLHESPLVVGSNFFPENLRDLVQDNTSKVNFSQNLRNDSVFGDAACKSCQTDLPRLQSGLVGSQIWSLRIPCDAMYKDSVALTLEQVDAVSRLISNYPSNLTLIRSSNGVSEAFRVDQIGGLLSVTSGHSMDGRMSVLRTLHSLGVRLMSLTSNCSTAWATSYGDTIDANDTGLSDFGKAVVKEMNRLGMVIDLSESSHKTQLDVLNITKAPVIFSHAAAYGVVQDSRNIKDDVLQALKTNGGILMVTFAVKYITNNATGASISDVIKHINYVKNITGVSGVGIGAEFDAEGGTYPPSLTDVSMFPNLFDQLGDKSWNQDDLKKLAGQNFLRVLQQVEKVAKDSAALPADETFTLPTKSSCYSDYDQRNKSAGPSATTQSPVPTAATTITVPSSTTTPTPSPTPAPTPSPTPSPTPAPTPPSTTVSTIPTVSSTTASPAQKSNR